MATNSHVVTYELLQAVNEDCFNDDHILEESWDVIQTIEGIHRKYTSERVEAARKAVEEKNRKRGYYGEVNADD